MHKIAITGKFKCCKIYYSGLIKFHCYQIFSKTNNNLTKKLLVQFTIFLDSKVAFLSGTGDLKLFDAVTQTSKVLVSKDVFVSIMKN